ncbi:hypothetical protein N3K66_008823 [Trichothecium roseum]|uniref:Uncharacterized protein n=1 Tax=Trichothecium roseum TaxID=47278 RepID=A0ACC0URA5_9HYPO|nr:hypothetical protein N3K66_008823 [Trichothecium roseum]
MPLQDKEHYDHFGHYLVSDHADKGPIEINTTASNPRGGDFILNMILVTRTRLLPTNLYRHMPPKVVFE